MNIAQKSTDGHPVFQPPVSVENPAELNSADLPANQDNPSNNTFESQLSDLPSPDAPSASAYHVPPKRFAPRPNGYAHDDSFHRPPETEPLPDRCQFMFSDGRQCTMARSDIHPSLCFYHADREEQLFGDPTYRCETRKLDFPELYSASRDLSTAAGVNRALAQVFRMLAQRRISRQEAATFGHLARLLLRTISLMSAESLTTPADATDPVILSEGKNRSAQFAARSSCESPAANVYLQDELRGVDKVNQELSHVNKVESNDLSVPLSAPPNSCTPPIGASPKPPAERVAMSNSRKISTSEIAGLNPIQNQHLHKSAMSALCSSGRPPQPGSPAHADFACAGVVKPAFDAKAET